MGNTACLLADDGSLTLVDLTDGGSRTQRTVPAVNGPCDQYVLDGPVIYMTSAAGIQCIKARTGETVFSTREWPKGALRETASTSAAVVPPPNGLVLNPYTPYGTPSQPDPNGRQPPTLGRAEGGVLYTVSLPSRVVALAEK